MFKTVEEWLAYKAQQRLKDAEDIASGTKTPEQLKAESQLPLGQA